MVEIHRAFPGQLSLTTKFTQHCATIPHSPRPNPSVINSFTIKSRSPIHPLPHACYIRKMKRKGIPASRTIDSSLAPSIFFHVTREKKILDGSSTNVVHSWKSIDRGRGALQSSAKSMSSKCRVPPQGDAISVNVSRGESVQSGQARMQSPPDLPNSSASRYEWSTIRRVELTESGKSSLGLIEKFQRGSHQSWHATTVVDFSSQDASLNFRNL